MVRTFGRRVVAAATVGLIIGLGAAGCDSGHVKQVTEAIHPPQAIDNPLPPALPVVDSPAHLLRAVEWTYNIRSVWTYEQLFTDDFLWNCSPTDPAGNGSRGTPWTRSDELLFAKHFFYGGGPDQRAVVTMVLRLAPNLEVVPDPAFAAWDPLGRWHSSVRTPVELRATLADQSSIEIVGYATFSVVRGDSAAIPDELLQRGARPDSTRWYLRRWDEESVPPAMARRAPLGAQPSSATTWCALKERYR